MSTLQRAQEIHRSKAQKINCSKGQRDGALLFTPVTLMKLEGLGINQNYVDRMCTIAQTDSALIDRECNCC